ncbi:DUF2062 domain-containing protein [Paenibacillus sp. ACRRX]|uniref:DUF2062 domain-containing protein n=1 Tax=unclassified Paenibacillus TaxID=185978 RepID=UPI001EF45671|nr:MULTISPECIES: DUF2062 domain-containing protein [unclassified Paenibacillus]MCG7409812.1 DUF2062 domain-containing protein [Paenibacillus sp. ACRRX]MDK8183120.1 DUF2062 domain-containing protein [Paenibacillus sp. UMB4589-SE434]
MKRWLKYQTLKLMRTNGSASAVAKGFSIGLAIEMFTLPTAGLAFFLIFPFVYMLRGRMASALVGFIFGKIIYIPVAVLNERVGHWLLPEHFVVHFHGIPHWLNHLMTINLHLIVGGIIDGCILAFMMYLPVKKGLELLQQRRREKRRLQRMPT